MNDNVWPAQDIETIGACPLCTSTKRSLLHGDLVDRIFLRHPALGSFGAVMAAAQAISTRDRHELPSAEPTVPTTHMIRPCQRHRQQNVLACWRD